MEKPQCLRCIHYFATYNQHTPRGCKAYNFQSARIPSLIVKEETGQDCQAYKPREKKDPKKKALDLNDPKNW